jgi:hypothetical protein
MNKTGSDKSTANLCVVLVSDSKHILLKLSPTESEKTAQEPKRPKYLAVKDRFACPKTLI